jgi:hypothetical protein
MAILMIHDASNDTLAHYDEAIKRLEATGQGKPAGRLSHVAARKGNGSVVVDTWESQEAFERFAQTLVPLLQQIGSQLAPPETLPIHNTIAGR